VSSLRGPARLPVALTIAAVSVLLLGGCSLFGGETAPTPQPTATSETPQPDPQLDLGADAATNKPFFDMISQEVVDSEVGVDGRAFVDALVAGGFPKDTLEVTPDTTSIGDAADSVQFSALLGGECLVGQFGNVGYASAVTPTLATGRCLIGQTRPIDW